MHASASPFEAMAERLNWLGVSLEDDAFGQVRVRGRGRGRVSPTAAPTPPRGRSRSRSRSRSRTRAPTPNQAMLSSGIPKETIMKWTKDPQVP